jgi:hypothetical protein
MSIERMLLAVKGHDPDLLGELIVMIVMAMQTTGRGW